MTTELVFPQVQAYLDGLVPPRSPEMEAMEAYARDQGFPAIDAATGQLCYQIARMVGARSVFELGSGYGYSTAWFAKAVKENGGGVVHHVVWDEGLSQSARGHLDVLEFCDVVQFHVGEAVQTLSETPGPFDLIFNDIDKQCYPASLPIIIEKLRTGGMLLVDNMLWYGRIFDQNDRSESTEGVREITRLVFDDPAWIASLVPIRDGLLVAYRK